MTDDTTSFPPSALLCMRPASHPNSIAAYLSSATNSAEQMAEQERRVRDAAAHDGYAIDEHLIFREERRGGAEGAVGHDPRRPVLSSFLAGLAEGRLTCTRLYVSDMNRLSRELRYNRDVRALLGSYGVAIVSASALREELEGLLLESMQRDDGRLWDRARHSARIKEGLRRRREAGA